MIDLSFWNFPLSLILAAAFTLALALLSTLSGKCASIRALGSLKSAAVLSCVVAVMVAIEGTWGLELYHTWPFIAVMLLLILSTGLSVAEEIRRRSGMASVLCHLGLFVMLSASFWGAPDVSKTTVYVTEENSMASGLLPFRMKLDEFRIDYYGDGTSPKQYTSRLDIEGKKFETSVNHPCRYKGYSLYQQGYDTENREYSIIQAVRDPWFPLVLAGMLLMLAGSFLSLASRWPRGVLLPVLLVLAVLFSVVTLAKINFGTLVPALRSIWFVPHLIIYMLAYSVLAVALILALAETFGKRFFRADVPSHLLASASTLLLAGMLCGAVWAKIAWGDYWTWDAKECWAAATWLLTVAGLHSSGRRLAYIALAFLAMQVTWYGVNWLPSAAASIHTYR